VFYRLKVPARINILGNPADANEGDFATISAAVDVYAGAIVEPAEEIVLESGSREEIDPDPENPTSGNSSETPSRRQIFSAGSFPLPYDGRLDLMKGAFNQLYQFSKEFCTKAGKQGIRVAVWSDVPRQSGLGGSSLFVILTLAGLREFYQLDRRVHNDYTLAEIAQRVEAKELKITCGYADRYMPIFGGIAYVDYRGKLHQSELYNEPLATIERLDPWVEDLPIVAISTGVQHESGDVHGCMRPRYVEQYNEWLKKGGEYPVMVRLMRGAWETAWRGKIALLQNDLPAFGELMNTNHRLVDVMMQYCGFNDGAGWANNLFIARALDFGALGAKLTGAGGGGSVYALVSPGQEEQLKELWQKTAAEKGLNAARIFRPHICREGLTIQSEP
jgi:galactokinase/mevalonate kinase-like predicted kinase